jgi:branched-chain amino acid transport system permease protein
MLYRETGQFKTNYANDQAIFPIFQDRVAVLVVLLFAFVVVPMIANDYWLQAILIPVLVYALAALGLNILTGYCGQLSLGTGGFMAVGAYSAYKMMTIFPDLPIALVFISAGLFAAAVGVVFGLPSLRIKGFYLAVATLAAQFFLVWLFNKGAWFYNYNPSGTIDGPPREFLGYLITGNHATPTARYLTALGVLVIFCLIVKNLVRGRIGRGWMAIRDMDIAAEIIGIRPLRTKLLAFAISSFICGIAGAELFLLHFGSVETLAFDINLSFLVLFMIIIGGLGSVLGSVMGAAFMVLMPILLTNLFVGMLGIQAVTAKHIEFMVFGSLIIFFLIVEPQGLARLWQILKEKLRLWPFPY